MRKRKKPLLATISQARIDQLSNDLSEGIRSGTVEEMRVVALHFRYAYDRLNQQAQSIRSTLAALVLAEEMRSHAIAEAGRRLKDWPMPE